VACVKVVRSLADNSGERGELGNQPRKYRPPTTGMDDGCATRDSAPTSRERPRMQDEGDVGIPWMSTNDAVI
jgi:hypothetical protein